MSCHKHSAYAQALSQQNGSTYPDLAGLNQVPAGRPLERFTPQAGDNRYRVSLFSPEGSPAGVFECADQVGLTIEDVLLSAGVRMAEKPGMMVLVKIQDGLPAATGMFAASRSADTVRVRHAAGEQFQQVGMLQREMTPHRPVDVRA